MKNTKKANRNMKGQSNRKRRRLLIFKDFRSNAKFNKKKKDC